MCLAKFLVGLILLPVQACWSLPSSWLILTMVNPKKESPETRVSPEKAPVFGVNIKKDRVLRTRQPRGILKITLLTKMSSFVSSKPFLFASHFYSKCKTCDYFLWYNLGFKVCENNFCKVQRTHAFKNLLLIYLVWAAYESPVCVHPAPECFCTLQLITFG